MELFYGDRNPAPWSFSTGYSDYNNQYTQDYITTRYMQPPIEIKCCSRCEDRLRATLRNIPGVDSVMSTYHNKKLIVTGSADRNMIDYAVKHVQKRHRHFLLNPFRLLLFPRHSHSRYAPEWTVTHYDHRPNYYGNGGRYEQAPEYHYNPGSLFDSRHSRYSYH